MFIAFPKIVFLSPRYRILSPCWSSTRDACFDLSLHPWMRSDHHACQKRQYPCGHDLEVGTNRKNIEEIFGKLTHPMPDDIDCFENHGRNLSFWLLIVCTSASVVSRRNDVSSAARKFQVLPRMLHFSKQTNSKQTSKPQQELHE